MCGCDSIADTIIIVDMQPDPTTRFSNRVEAYERYRPSYPPEVLALAERECGLTASSRIADIGSGTGQLAALLLRSGCELFAVEPNEEMRQAGMRVLGGSPRYHSLEGRAEDTGLPAASIDVVTAGQAFHWFDVEWARVEFRRILKPGGSVMLAWNERRPAPGFMQ